LGYSYPELQPWLDKYKKDGEFKSELYRADIAYQITKLYSPVGFKASNYGNNSGDTAVAPTADVELTPGPGYNSWTKYAGWKDYIINVTYNRYTLPRPLSLFRHLLLITQRRFALNGVPYALYFFIGPKSELDLDDGPLHESKYHVGFLYNFSNPVYHNRATPGCKNCRRKAAEGTDSRGQLPITGALIAKIQDQEDTTSDTELELTLGTLPNLELDSVEQYLEKNLYWSVGTVCDICCFTKPLVFSNESKRICIYTLSVDIRDELYDVSLTFNSLVAKPLKSQITTPSSM